MKYIAMLLLALFALPTVALARHAAHPHPTGCAPQPHHPPKEKHPQPPCVAGTVATVSGHGMNIQPVHGHTVRLVFVPKTIFQTTSGSGTLEGIMPGDFACVMTISHRHMLVAQRVVFDLRPFPCLPKKKPHPASTDQPGSTPPGPHK